MKVDTAREGIKQVFLDTAPIIYYVENNPNYYTVAKVIFDAIDNDLLLAVTSPVTLSELMSYQCWY